jgi:hypothetical protein
MEELADRVGELKAAKRDLDAYLERLKALFVASGRDEAEGVLFRVVLGAESVATTLDRKAIEAAMGESWLARFLKFGKPSRLSDTGVGGCYLGQLVAGAEGVASPIREPVLCGIGPGRLGEACGRRAP